MFPYYLGTKKYVLIHKTYRLTKIIICYQNYGKITKEYLIIYITFLVLKPSNHDVPAVQSNGNAALT